MREKLETVIICILTIWLLVATVLFWAYKMQQAQIDQRLSVQCVDQGGIPIVINGKMSCLHKISRIA